MHGLTLLYHVSQSVFTLLVIRQMEAITLNLFVFYGHRYNPMFSSTQRRCSSIHNFPSAHCPLLDTGRVTQLSQLMGSITFMAAIAKVHLSKAQIPTLLQGPTRPPGPSDPLCIAPDKIPWSGQAFSIVAQIVHFILNCQVFHCYWLFLIINSYTLHFYFSF